MPSCNPLSWWRRFLALPNSHPLKTLGVVLLVALSCSIFVSIAAVKLGPLQEANRLRESAASMMKVLDWLGAGPPEARLVELPGGAYVFHDPGARTALSPDQDIASLEEREDVATVYEVREDDELQLVVLPVRGSGYKSTIEGYLVLESDLNTVAALSFYEHDETPGLGARIEEEGWQALWRGKEVADAQGVIRIEVVEGDSAGPHEVDAISGATRTSQAVANLLHFWLGPNGYGPYLARLKEETRQ